MVQKGGGYPLLTHHLNSAIAFQYHTTQYRRHITFLRVCDCFVAPHLPSRLEPLCGSVIHRPLYAPLMNPLCKRRTKVVHSAVIVVTEARMLQIARLVIREANSAQSSGRAFS